MQRSRAAWADGTRNIDHRLDARQLGRQRAAVGSAPGGTQLALGRVLLLGVGLARCGFLLGVFQRELKLVLGQALVSMSCELSPSMSK
jgi:hypothetical protein